MILGTFTYIKNERYVEEFIEYYLKIGFDYIILFDDNSDSEHTALYKNVILKCKKNNKKNVKLLHRNKFIINVPKNDGFHWNNNHWNNNIIPIIKKYNIDYIFVVDCDEFLYIKDINVKNTLKKYLPFDCLQINWLFFGNNNLKYNNTGSVINSFTLSESDLSTIYKSITSINAINFETQPYSSGHKFILKNNSITKCAVYPQENMSYKQTDIYLAHYSCQDVYSLIKRKFVNQYFWILVNQWLKLNINYKLNETKELANYVNENIHTITEYVYNEVNDLKQNNSNIDIQNKELINSVIVGYYKVLNLKTKENNFDIINIFN